MLVLLFLAQAAAADARTLAAPAGAAQRGGSISARAGEMKVNKKAFDGFGDPPPPREKPVLSGSPAPKGSPKPKATPPPKAKKKGRPKAG